MKSQKGGRKASSIPIDTVEYLKAWMMSPEHIAHPYPTEQEKAEIMAETGIEMKQLTNWFVNNRKRFWKPRVESAQFKKFATSSPSAPSPRAHPSSKKNDGQLGIATHRPKRSKPAEKQSSTSFLPSNRSSTRGGRASSFGKPAYIQEVDDTHPISDGSSYTQSDDDSLGSGGTHRSTNFGVIAQQYLDSLAKANSSSASSTEYRKNEQVEVLILRPEGSVTSNGSTDSEESLPTIRDVTIRSSAPEDRILASFKCHISYTVPHEIEHDKKKVQTRRDGEVLRMKKHYLKLYLATRGIHSASSPTGSDASINTIPPSSASSVSSVITEGTSSARSTNAVSPVVKRPHVFGKEEEVSMSPRKRVCTLSGSFVEGEEAWKELCTQADCPFSDSLPSLEEASRMFGYVSS